MTTSSHTLPSQSYPAAFGAARSHHSLSGLASFQNPSRAPPLSHIPATSPPRPSVMYTAGPPMGTFSPSDCGFDPTAERPCSPTLLRRSSALSGHHAGNSTNAPSTLFPATEQPDKASKASAWPAPNRTLDVTTLATAAANGKRTGRDSKRRATHSQIERRRREKINDRLITLRNLVPACVREVEDRQKAKTAEEEEAQLIAAGLATASSQKGKRKRNRRKASEAKAAAQSAAGAADKDPELGLHKLEVLTHAIDYIYQLQARIQELETGVRPERVQRVEDKDELELEDDSSHEKQTDSRRMSMADVPMNGVDDGSHDGRVRDEGRSSIPKSSARPKQGEQLTQSSSRAHKAEYSRSVSPQSDSSATAPSTAGAASPIFSSGRTTSTSVSSITSPFMSLSASSPIFMSGKHIGGSNASAMSSGLAQLALPPPALGDAERYASHDTLRSPAPLVSPVQLATSRSQHGSTSAVRAGASVPDPLPAQAGTLTETDYLKPDESSAAQLLLAFSKSPEGALRPQGASSTSNGVGRTTRKRIKADVDTDADGDSIVTHNRPELRRSVATLPACSVPRDVTAVAGTMSATVGNYFPSFATPQFRPTLVQAASFATSRGGFDPVRPHIKGHDRRHSREGVPNGYAAPSAHRLYCRMPGSAPGGSTATKHVVSSQQGPRGDTLTAKRLVSPPPLALDDSSSSNGGKSGDNASPTRA
ncbi:unnamed protein product [Parajaminaea phylloscopi]